MHLLLPLVTMAALRVPGPLSPRNASYEITARLDEQAKTVTGKERIHWRNLARGAADSLVFHLYMNAFKNDQSTFFAEARGQHRGVNAKEHGFGAIDVTRLVVGGVDLTAALVVDDTLGTVELRRPIAASATVDIDVEFTVLLPKVFARAGYHDDFFAVAQWFPKLGVFECDGACRWRAHQHHLNSEFFADYGVYDVDVDVPGAFVVGATGVLTGERRQGARKTLSFHAEDVHDFVFAASPRFVRYEDRLSDALGEVRIVFLSQRGREANVPRHLTALKRTMAELARRFAPFPYSQITVVDPPEGAFGAGGMEYPTLIFTLDLPTPPGVHAPEYVTAHEFAHQYFYGLIASDEVEEAWLDEGFTEAMTDFSMVRLFGRAASLYDFAGHKLSLTQLSQLRYRGAADVDPLTTRAFDYLSNRIYGAVTYAKTDLILQTLNAYLGAPAFEAGMRRYFDGARFSHPRELDFVRLFDAGVGRDLSWFWRPALFSSDRLDYQILDVRRRRRLPPVGLFDENGRRVEKSEASRPDLRAGWISEVVVHRKGEITFPVEVRVVFEDGSQKRETWDGGENGERWRRFVYETPKPVAYAEVDPDDKVPLDADRFNNSLRAAPDAGPRRRIAAWLEHLLSTLLSTVGL